MQLTSSQKRGIIVLFGILVAIIGIRLRAIYLAKQPVPQKTEIDSVKTQRTLLDLNLATEEELEKLPGIGPVLAGRILKFRNSIGGFDSVDELAKVYGLKPETFELVKPLVFVGEKPKGNHQQERRMDSSEDSFKKPLYPDTIYPKFEKPNREFLPKPFYKVDLNQADSLALDKVPGIGALTASRILAQRKGLGYFHSVEQLMEVRGISPENFEKMKTHLFLEGDFLEFPHLKINQATFAELKIHPYLGYKPAQLIDSYRAEHGPYKSMADLKKIYGIDSKTWNKIEPYIEF